MRAEDGTYSLVERFLVLIKITQMINKLTVLGLFDRVLVHSESISIEIC